MFEIARFIYFVMENFTFDSFVKKSFFNIQMENIYLMRYMFIQFIFTILFAKELLIFMNFGYTI